MQRGSGSGIRQPGSSLRATCTQAQPVPIAATRISLISSQTLPYVTLIVQPSWKLGMMISSRATPIVFA